MTRLVIPSTARDLLSRPRGLTWRAMLGIAVVALTSASCRLDRKTRADRSDEAIVPTEHAQSRWGVGRTATPEEIGHWAKDAAPNGAGLPHGSGTVAQGATLFAARCAACHGANGEGMAPAYPRLIGRDPRQGFPFGRDPKAVKTIGNYWPYATTIYDYVQRAMPLTAPGSLAPDEIYAVTAYLLARNEIIPDTTTLDSARLVSIRMPARDRFVPDDRRGGRELR